MSGRNKLDVVAEATAARMFVEFCGHEALCPVTAEEVKAEDATLLATKEQMDTYWYRDKAMIREANVIFDMTPMMNSEGSKHEIGYARYFLWKPVLRVFPYQKLPASSSVAYFEDDSLTEGLNQAINVAEELWGTRWKRFKWRVRLYRRSYLKACWYKLLEWFR